MFRIFFIAFTERNSESQSSWCHCDRGWPTDAGGTVHVRTSWHGDPDRRKGERGWILPVIRESEFWVACNTSSYLQCCCHNNEPCACCNKTVLLKLKCALEFEINMSSGSQVDVFLKTQSGSGRWVMFDTVVTSNSGRVSYTIPSNKRLGLGVYPIKMVVK